MKFNLWLYKLECKISRFAIERLMSIITVAMSIVFVMDLLLMFSDSATGITSWLIFDRRLIFQGQIWRIFTFIFVYPQSTNILMSVLGIYFFWWSGNAVESRLGKAKFNLYYLFGIIGTLIAGLILGYISNTYLNLTLFLAFAVMFPDVQVLLFFIIPIKVKWLGILEGVLLVITFFLSNIVNKVAILVAILNFLLFFGRDLIRAIKNTYREFKWRNGNYN